MVRTATCQAPHTHALLNKSQCFHVFCCEIWTP
jgi:hypothetical protein